MTELPARLLYVETTQVSDGYYLEAHRSLILDGRARRAEALAKQLCVEPVASASRIVDADTDPFPWRERGYERTGQDPFGRFQYVQGFALATWQAFYYPTDGNWRGWDWDTGYRAISLGIDLDEPPPWRIDPLPRYLGDPLEDWQTWIGATTERQYVTRLREPIGNLRPPWDVVREALQARRAQADGRPLWTTPKVVPEPIRERHATAFVCHARNEHLIPEGNLAALRRLTGVIPSA